MHLSNVIPNQPSSDRLLLLDIHKMYGHASVSTLKPIIKDLFTSEELTRFQCNSCLKSKITQSLFSCTSSPSNKPLDRIHLDLVGPISPQSNAGHHYILTLVDNFSGYLAAFPLTSKDKTAETIINLLENEYKRLNYYPSEIFSDKGTEFVNSALKEFAKTKHIKLQTSEPIIPNTTVKLKEPTEQSLNPPKPLFHPLNYPKTTGI